MMPATRFAAPTFVCAGARRRAAISQADPKVPLHLEPSDGAGRRLASTHGRTRRESEVPKRAAVRVCRGEAPAGDQVRVKRDAASDPSRKKSQRLRSKDKRPRSSKGAVLCPHACSSPRWSSPSQPSPPCTRPIGPPPRRSRRPPPRRKRLVRRPRRRWTTRRSWPSRSTIPTSRSCATCATSRSRAARRTSTSWTSPPRSTRRPCISARSPSRRA